MSLYVSSAFAGCSFDWLFASSNRLTLSSTAILENSKKLG